MSKIVHRVVWEKLFEFSVELGSERLVVRDYQRRLVDLLNDVGHREGLAGTGCPEKDLMLLIVQNVFGEGINGCGLVAGWLEWRVEFEHGGGGMSKDLGPNSIPDVGDELYRAPDGRRQRGSGAGQGKLSCVWL